MKKWWMLSALLAAWVILGYALFQTQNADAGAKAAHRREPERIVSMAPSLTEILFALGLGDRVVGVTQFSDYPLAALEKPKVGTFWQPNLEAIIAVKPSLVVLALASMQQKSLADRLERMGYGCLRLDIRKVHDLFETIAATGAATGTEKQAERVISGMKVKMAELQAATAARCKVKVLWVVQREPLRVAGRDTFVNEIIEMAGGENAIGPTRHKYPPIGGEQVIASSAEVIIEPAMMGGALEQQLLAARSYWRRFETVPAVANGRIHVIRADVVSRLGPRLCEGIEEVARCLRPEVFGE